MPSYLSPDKSCLKCGHRMTGVNNYQLRKYCESCGGNVSNYNAHNPHPESDRAKEMKTSQKEKHDGK